MWTLKIIFHNGDFRCFKSKKKNYSTFHRKKITKIFAKYNKNKTMHRQDKIYEQTDNQKRGPVN